LNTFVTPSHHRVHHSTNDQYIDKNFGSTLIIWDRMFGTFEAEEEQAVYGITTPIILI
jgi:sterol desaturase/sphingolipid hydroxylase (fatty acid hydroxylase superfamily)